MKSDDIAAFYMIFCDRANEEILKNEFKIISGKVRDEKKINPKT